MYLVILCVWLSSGCVIGLVLECFPRDFPLCSSCSSWDPLHFVKDRPHRVPPYIIWYHEPRFLTNLEPPHRFLALFCCVLPQIRKFPTKNSPKIFCDLLVWWDFVDFDLWICLVSSGSSISPSFPTFRPQNLLNFAPKIIHFRPKSRPGSQILRWPRTTG